MHVLRESFLHALRLVRHLTIFATGTMVYESLKAAELLANQGISSTVVDIHTIKPIDINAIEKACKSSELIVSVEEHSIIGGLASAVAEIAVRDDLSRAKIRPFAAPDEVIHETGSHEYLRSRAGLTSQNITKQIDQYLKEWKLC